MDTRDISGPLGLLIARCLVESGFCLSWSRRRFRLLLLTATGLSVDGELELEELGCALFKDFSCGCGFVFLSGCFDGS